MNALNISFMIYVILTQNMKHYSNQIFCLFVIFNLKFNNNDQFKAIIFINYIILQFLFISLLFFYNMTKNTQLENKSSFEPDVIRMIRNFYIHLSPLVQVRNINIIHAIDYFLSISTYIVYFILTIIFKIDILEEYNLK